MYVIGCHLLRQRNIGRDILAQSADLPETAVTDHALCRVFRRIHQAVCLDDPSVCQYHAGHTIILALTCLILSRYRWVVGEFRNDDRFGAVLRVHELSGIVSSLLASLYFHPAVGQLYRIGKVRE